MCGKLKHLLWKLDGMMQKPWDTAQQYKVHRQGSPAGHKVAEVGYTMCSGIKDCDKKVHLS